MRRRAEPYGPTKAKRNIHLEEQVSFTDFVPVRGWDVKEDLYDPSPEQAVECDACGERWPSGQGHLCGAKGVPWSVRFRFICIKCNPRRRCEGALCGVRHRTPSEETASPPPDDVSVDDDRLSEDSWEDSLDGMERTISQEEDQGFASDSGGEEDTQRMAAERSGTPKQHTNRNKEELPFFEGNIYQQHQMDGAGQDE